MTCRELIDFLAAYLDGDLDEQRRSVFEHHLSICPSCVDYVKSYETTVALEQRLGTAAGDELPEELPEGLLDAVLAAVRSEKDR